MDTYRIITQKNPPRLAIPTFSQPGFFFHEPCHLHHQPDDQFYSLSALNQRTGQADARCAFFIQSTRAFSPVAAPFGSIECTASLPDLVLNQFVETVLTVAQQAGASTLRFVNYPTCYVPIQAERLTNIFLAHGFVIAENQPTFFLPITANDFVQTIVPAERRRLRKCEQAGFHVVHQCNPDVTYILSFLEEMRQQKGYPLTIPTSRLSDLLLNFPEQYPVFTVLDGNDVIALVVAVRVRHDILYSFLPASHPDYAAYSPMVLLTKGLFQYCQQQAIRLLDLGLSLDHCRQPKPSLMRFKRNLGAQESPKLVFECLL